MEGKKMKKLALLAALVLLAAFVTPVIASDFSVGGEFRTRALSKDLGAGEDQDYFDQRFRLSFKWDVNDNVRAQLNGDFAEFVWGDGYRPETGTDTLMIDRAFVRINQGILQLIVGQQYGQMGYGLLWADQFQGIQAKVKLDPVTIHGAYVKESEGGAAGNTTTDDGVNDDTDTYAVSANFANDMLSGGIAYAHQENSATFDEKYGISVYVTAGLSDRLTLSGEGAMFGGDNGSGTDYEGVEFFVNLDARLTDMASVSLLGLWADDVSSNETQLVAVHDDNQFRRFSFPGNLTYAGLFGGATDIFDVSGNGKGAQGVLLTGKLVPIEGLTIWAKAGYVEPNGEDALDNKTFLIGNFDYVWLPVVTVSGGVGYVSPDYSDNTNDDSIVTLAAQLTVAF